MSEGVFRFRRFSVYNSIPGQKVGTDGVLLGAAVSLDFPGPVKVLDIGTGTGVIALMLAQRLSQGLSDALCPAEITAIDIDEQAALSAAASFRESPWSDILHSHRRSLQDFADDLYGQGRLFDLIVSNPPYYDNSLPCPDPQRDAARHTESLSWREVITFAGDFLSPQGLLALILPKQEEKRLLRFASSFGFCPSRLLSISTTQSKPPSRLIAEFTRAGAVRAQCRQEIMVIGNAKYHSIVDEFYL